MNRRYNQFRWQLENKMVDLWTTFTVGAVGAPTLNASASKGIASIARVSAGTYDITLQDAYVALRGAYATIQLAAGSPASLSMVVRTSDVNGAKVVRVSFLDGALAAAELESGVAASVKLELKASGV